jgi:hypothetical protein
MKHFVCILLLISTFAHAQVLQKGEKVYIEGADGLYVSPNNEWIIFRTYNDSKKTGQQRSYLINQKGEKKNELVGCHVLGFSKDAKSVMVIQTFTDAYDRTTGKIRELSLPDLKIIGELDFGKRVDRTEFDNNIIYLPQKNRLLVFISERTDTFRDEIYLEAWDWGTKKLLKTNRKTPFLKYLTGVSAHDFSLDEKRALFTFHYSNGHDELHYQPLVLDVETLQLVSTIDLKEVFERKAGELLGSTSQISANGNIVSMFEYANSDTNYDTENQTYNPTVCFWDANTGRLIKKEKWKTASIMGLSIDSNEQIIATGFFGKMQDGVNEALRKIDYKSWKIVSTYRTADFGSIGYLKNRSTIFWLDQLKNTLTPFDLKTWSKGNPIKL